MRIIILLPLLFQLKILCTAQVTVAVTIENQYTEGSDFIFDVYLHRASSSNQGDLYLKDANLFIDFNEENFRNPVFSKVGDSPGHCTLRPIIRNENNELMTAINYYDNTSTSIHNHRLTIEINGPAPSDQSVFDTRVAKIDHQQLTHRLGTFKISGITNPKGTAGLKWYTSGSPLISQIITMNQSGQFFGSQVKLNAIDPVDASLPIAILNFKAEIYQEEMVKLQWQTVDQLIYEGFEIEKRFGADEWRNIGIVEGNRNSSVKSFDFIDKNPIKGINFYRLRERYPSDQFNYSSVVSIYFSNSKGIEVFPNPVSDFLFVEGNADGQFQIVSSNGTLVMEGLLENKPIDVAKLPTGIYVIKSGEKTIKFIKW